MTETIGTLVAAHAAGKALTATIEETYARIESHTIRRSSSPSARKRRLWRLRSACRRRVPRAGPSMGFPSSSRTISTSPGFRRRRPVPPSPIVRGNRRSSSTGSSAPARSSSARPISTSSRPASSASARPTGFPQRAQARSIPGGSSSGSATAVARASSRSRSAPTPRDRGACRRRSTGSWASSPRSALFPAPASSPPAGRSTRSRSSPAVSRTRSRSMRRPALSTRATPTPRVSSACPFGAAGRNSARRSTRRQRQFFDDATASAAFLQDLELARSLGARIVEFDFEPFAEVARALYEGPWVAERYAAVKALIESHPGRSIRSRARSSRARASSTRSRRSRPSTGSPPGAEAAHVWSEFDAMLVPTAPRPYAIAEVEADPIRLNCRLGTYTNFVNLLDLCAECWSQTRRKRSSHREPTISRAPPWRSLHSPLPRSLFLSLAYSASFRSAKALTTLSELDTQPNMPPCALIILRPMAWTPGNRSRSSLRARGSRSHGRSPPALWC